MKYSPEILDLFYSVSHVRQADGDYTLQSSFVVQDIQLVFYVSIVDKIIQTMHFKTTGNTIVIVVSEYVCRYLENKAVSAVSELLVDSIIMKLKINKLYQHNVLLVIEALKSLKE